MYCWLCFPVICSSLLLFLGGERFFSVFSFTRWYLEAFSVGMTCLPFLWNESLFFGFQLYCLLFCRTYSNMNLFYGIGGCAILYMYIYISLYLKICNSSENVSTRMLWKIRFVLFLIISFIYIYIYMLPTWNKNYLLT